MRMIADCRAGKINKVLVKSISRFARNTVDALKYIQELKELGISVYFENENIDTLTPGGEVLITILAAMAEQESRTMSTNIKWTYQKKFKNGEVILNTGLMMGYINTGRKDDEGKVIYAINEEEAEIVRPSAEGYSLTSYRRRDTNRFSLVQYTSVPPPRIACVLAGCEISSMLIRLTTE